MVHSQHIAGQDRKILAPVDRLFWVAIIMEHASSLHEPSFVVFRQGADIPVHFTG